jgi:protein-disulfide isomerase
MTFAAPLLLVASQLITAASTPVASPAAAEPVEIVLYSDFQCPFCTQLAPAIREIQAKGIDAVQPTVVFKNFPLSIHPNSQLAHQAAMAAREQGKFWEMHDLLFANQSQAQRSDLVGYARRLGLNVARFEHDLDSERIKKLIATDVAEGNKLGVIGTPS